MSQIENTLPRRRGLLAGSALALLTGVGAAVAHAATLAGTTPEIRCPAGEFWRLDAVRDQWNAERVSWEVGEAAQDGWWERLDAMAAIRATTPEGIRTPCQISKEGARVVLRGAVFGYLKIVQSRGARADHPQTGAI